MEPPLRDSLPALVPPETSRSGDALPGRSDPASLVARWQAAWQACGAGHADPRLPLSRSCH